MEDNDNGMLREKEGNLVTDKWCVVESQDSRGQVSPILEKSQDEENVNLLEQIMKQPPKKRRGPTKMKTIAAIEEHNKMDITYNEYGQPNGKNSTELASYLGPLVREVVPVTLQDWRKLSTRLKETLWTSIQLKYNMKEARQRTYLFQKMGRLWRVEKSRIVSKIQKASSDEDLVKLKPSNIQSMSDWMEFVKEKKSVKFKATGEKFKSMKKRQLPHTCSRKGYARSAEDMKKSCSSSSLVTRVALWTRDHGKKDSNPVNSQVAETLASRIEATDTVAKKCLDFHSNAQRKRRSKRLKSLSVGLATMEDNDNGMLHEKEGNLVTDKLCVDESQDSRGQVSQILEKSQDEENVNMPEQIMKQPPKKCRGPTKMRTIAIDEHNKMDITYNEYGQPIGKNSIGLASFLGPLVREVVPVTLQDWRKLPTRLNENLWTSIQLRYNMTEAWQRTYFFQKMGKLWRAGKSRIVSKIQMASSDEELVKLKPNNVQSMSDWMDFVKEKKSVKFKATSEKFKSMKKRQLPHTCSRKGYARLAEEMSCSSSSLVTRVALWTRAHRKKDGNPVNSQVAETLESSMEATDTVAKKCLDFHSNAQQKWRFKRLKSLSVGQATMEDNDNGMLLEKEGNFVADNLRVDESQDSRGQVSRIIERSQVEQNVNLPEQIMEQPPKKCRGPSIMKTIATEEHNKMDITYNEFGQPIGKNSIGLASFLGPLVREVVPVTLQDWRKLPTRLKEILWTSIQLRYNMTEAWQRTYFLQKMGKLWRSGKSRIVSKIQMASSDEELVKLKPSNIQSMSNWMDFVKEKKSVKFKATSEKFKSMKKRQLPHTCSRKGYARLAEEMKKSCSNSSSVTRVALWTRAHRKKDGIPVNSQVAETLERIEKIDNEGTNTSSTNMDNDAISKVLGPDRGHIRGLGFGVTFSKLSASSRRESYVQLEEKYKKIEGEMTKMRSLISQILKVQGNTSEQLSNATNEPVINNIAIDPVVSSPLSVNNNNALRKCKLLDWCGTGDIVAEGRWSSNDPKVLVHHVPLGPQAVKVWVDLPIKHDAFLWRPNSEMTYIEDANGSTTAWPLDKVLID